MSLHAGEDPDKLLNKIEHIQRQLKNLGVDYSDEQAVAFILHAGIVPNIYAPLIPVLLSAEDISFSSVKGHLRAFHARLAGSHALEQGSNDAHALHAMSTSTGATRNARRCNRCKRHGHLATECRLNQHTNMHPAQLTILPLCVTGAEDGAMFSASAQALLIWMIPVR